MILRLECVIGTLQVDFVPTGIRINCNDQSTQLLGNIPKILPSKISQMPRRSNSIDLDVRNERMLSFTECSSEPNDVFQKHGASASGGPSSPTILNLEDTGSKGFVRNVSRHNSQAADQDVAGVSRFDHPIDP